MLKKSIEVDIDTSGERLTVDLFYTEVNGDITIEKICYVDGVFDKNELKLLKEFSSIEEEFLKVLNKE